MHGLFIILGIILCGIVITSCTKTEKPPESIANLPAGKKVLIAYYSESATKNTRTAAQWIQKYVGGDMAELVPVTPYPPEYRKVLVIAHKEIKEKTTPELQPLAVKPEEYDIIFVGTPVWYGTFAPPVRTFLAGTSWKGKTLVPFCTHGGGGKARTFREMEAVCPDARVLPGLELRGTNIVQRKLRIGLEKLSSPAQVAQWLEQLPWMEEPIPEEVSK
ncbi:MAG: NAD(P)H-dependent oxidoreductase [Victivallales bacterium]|nr:NAD(P)H-dependent oxidoreductase [Victivallales bacterium]